MMHLLLFFALACATFRAASALPLSKPINDLAAREDMYTFYPRDLQFIEAHGRGKDHKGSKRSTVVKRPQIKFVGGKDKHNPQSHLDRLKLHADSRKEVLEWHRKVIEHHMPHVPGAHSAEVINLAHARGSKDPNIHISAKFHDKEGKLIHAKPFGDSHREPEIPHVHVNQEHKELGYQMLPKAYTHALDKHLISIGEHPGQA